VAFGDLDNDGGIDLVISHINEPVVLLRNQVPSRGHWLGIGLVGKPCRDAVGAKSTFSGFSLSASVYLHLNYLNAWFCGENVCWGGKTSKFSFFS
jgi:hypothetical protein